ncbi:testis-expressed protein 44 [Dasypus novemcinctus]|uniref:testis-expressed protein 44 n=1 Tax=Dasypus novemcinctus TaxID=9361 RepID=UPI00265E8AF8|nr:testis-expressed protein 44 [Dasypus novemcinctus]
MSTVLSGEAGAAKEPEQDGTPHSPTRGSPGQGPLPADVPTASGAAAPANQQDVRQASVPAATSEDKDNRRDVVPELGKEKPEGAMASQLVHQPLMALKTSTSLYNPERGRPPQENLGPKTAQSLLVLQHEALDKKETPQTRGVPNREPELAPPALNAAVQLPKAVDAHGQPDTQTAGNAEAVEKPEEPVALNLEAEASPSSEPRGVLDVNLVDGSKDLRAWSYPPTPVGSAPPSPDSQEVALGRRALDSSLYLADGENGYMRSMTSLLGGGEGSISSLADILVWSDATVGMATSFLSSGHGSVSDLLHGSGPSLRSVSSILGGASAAFSSGLATGTGSTLRSVTNLLGAVERRTVEGMRSAARFFAGLLAAHRAPAGHNRD